MTIGQFDHLIPIEEYEDQRQGMLDYAGDITDEKRAILIADWDAFEALKYSRNRKTAYDLLNQDEMRFDDQVNGTTTWVDAILAIKTAHPKP